MLIGELLLNENINLNHRTVLASIRKEWNISENKQILELGTNAFVFSFSSKIYKEYYVVAPCLFKHDNEYSRNLWY